MIASLLVAAASVLSAGSSIRDSLAGHETMTFSVVVPAETAARVDVRQEGIDIEVIIRPAGSDLPEHGLDMVAGPNGDEVRYLPISDAPAAWNVIVRGVLPRAPRGGFTISLDTRPADDHSRAIAATRQLYQDMSDLDWLGTTEKTRSMCDAVAEQAAANGDTELQAEATYQAARRRDVLGDLPGAIEWQTRALAMFRQLGRRDRESRALNRLGDYARKSGDIRESDEFFRDALPMARDTGDRLCEVDIIGNRAILLSSTDRLEEALDQMQSAIPIALDLGTANVESALWASIASIYSRLGMPEKAVDACERGVDRVRHSNLPQRRLGRALHQLAVAYFELGDRTKADATMREALEILEKAKDVVYLAEARTSAGEMQRAEGDLERANESFEKALPPLREAHVRGSVAAALIAWSEVDFARGDFDAATGKLDEAVSLARQIAARDIEAKALYLRARSLQKNNRIDDAIASATAAIDIVEAMRGSIARTDLRTSYLTTVSSYYDLAIDLMQQRGRTADAYAISERARARVLLESLAASVTKIRKGVDPALLARERELRAELNAKDRYRAEVVLKEGEGSARAAALAKIVAQRVSDLAEVRARIRETSPAYAALEMPEPVTVREIQKTLLDGDTSIVAFALGESRSYAWVIDRKAITVHPMAREASIEKLAREYHDLLSRDIDALTAADRGQVARQTRAAGRRLAEAVWTPVAKRARTRRLVILADGALQYVPFAALPSSSGEPLIVEHEIVYAPSASVLKAIRGAQHASAMHTAMVFADPVFTADDPRVTGVTNVAQTQVFTRGGPYTRLQFSRREAEAIAGVAGPRTLEALDFSAAKSAVVDRDLRRYDIIHFATHGYVDAEQPELSGLVLSLVDPHGKAIDGFLHLYDIYNLDLHAQLVVLSACRTALGKEVHGEGLIGLTRAFVYAGSARVVSTMWNVDDRASAKLVAEFYSSMLVKKQTPAAALRAAQLSLLRQARWSDPHYWAPFGLHGEWR